MLSSDDERAFLAPYSNDCVLAGEAEARNESRTLFSWSENMKKLSSRSKGAVAAVAVATVLMVEQCNVGGQPHRWPLITINMTTHKGIIIYCIGRCTSTLR